MKVNKKLLIVILSIALAGAIVLAVVLGSCQQTPAGNTGNGKPGGSTDGTTLDPVEAITQGTEALVIDFNELFEDSEAKENGQPGEDDGDNSPVWVKPAETEPDDFRIPLGDVEDPKPSEPATTEESTAQTEP